MKYAATTILALLSMSCGPAESTTAAATPLKLNWDLSIDNRVERVHWPADVTDDVWLIGGPGMVRFKSRDGIAHDVAFRSAQVWREGARVKNISFIRDIGTVAEVYADAIKLADDWQIKDRGEIEMFRRTDARRITSGRSGVYGVAGGKELLQGRGIEIRQSFDSASGKPYLAIMGFGFRPDYDGLSTATAPATRTNDQQ